MASRASRASLDGLPNELLLEIVQKCIARDRGIAGASAFLIAAINRRFRSLALPYAFKEGLHVSSYKRLSAMFEPFRPHLSEIKTITVGHEPLYQISLSHDLHGYSFYKGRRFPARLDFPSLHNLVNFDCAGFSFEPRQLEQVFGVSNPRLQSLRLRWSAAHHFPFENFPSLQHLFVYIFFDVDLPEPSRPFPLVFPSLITLSVMTNMGWFSSKIEGQVIFPNLSAFHLLPNSSSSDLGFIYDNPTLREVSVSPVTVDFPSFVRLASLNHMEHPDSWNDLALNGFSFLRAAQQEHADPVAPHKLIELGMEMSPYHSPLLLQDIGELGEFPLFADCTRLSLGLPNDSDDDPDLNSVASIVSVLGESLGKWTKLRHIVLDCIFPSVWDDQDDSSSAESSSNFPSVDMRLPMDGDNPLDFLTYCEREFDVMESTEDFQQSFIELGLECRDDTCAMQLWKATREKAMATWVRRLATACMTLEVFEWSMRAHDFASWKLSLGLCAHPPLWRWDIHRSSHGGVESLCGSLTWNGLSNHPLSCLNEQFKKRENWAKRGIL